MLQPSGAAGALYEVSILLVVMIERKRAKEDAARAGESAA